MIAVQRYSVFVSFANCTFVPESFEVFLQIQVSFITKQALAISASV